MVSRGSHSFFSERWCSVKSKLVSSLGLGQIHESPHTKFRDLRKNGSLGYWRDHKAFSIVAGPYLALNRDTFSGPLVPGSSP